MHQMKIVRLRLAVLASLLAGHSVVSAFDFEPAVGAGLLYTDNATLAPSDEVNDLIVVGYLGAGITKDEGPLRVNVAADVIHLNYTDDTFENQTYPGLRAIVEWEQVRGRLDWKVQNFLTQQRINAVSGVTPDNIQNTNVFTFGTDIGFLVTGRQSLSITPEFRDFSYEDFGTDNRQYSLSANWAYQMYRTLGVGLTGKYVDVNYDSSSDNNVPDYTRRKVHFNISGTGARSTYSASLGATKVKRDNSGTTDAFTGHLALQYSLTVHSSVRAYLASNITDTGNILLNSETDPENGGFSNVQTSDEVVRNKIMRLTYTRDDDTLQTLVWGELRKLDYELALNDRDVRDFGAQLDYRMNPEITTSLLGRYSQIDRTDIGVTDDYYSITGTIAYNLTRKLITSLDLRYQEQKSDSGSFNEFKEFSSFVRLVYGKARVARPDSRSRL